MRNVVFLLAACSHDQSAGQRAATSGRDVFVLLPSAVNDLSLPWSRASTTCLKNENLDAVDRLANRIARQCDRNHLVLVYKGW